MECHLWWSVVRLGGCSHFKQVHPGKNCAGSFCSLAQLADPQRKIWSITIIITVRLSFCHVGLRDLKHFWGWAVSASWRKLEVDAATGFSVFSVFFHFCFFCTFWNLHCSIQKTCRIEKQGSSWISSTFTIAKTLKLKEHVNCFACFYQFWVHHFKWVFQKYAFQHFNNICCSKKWFNIQFDLITVTGQSLMRRGIDELVSLAASSKGCWCLSLWMKHQRQFS